MIQAMERATGFLRVLNRGEFLADDRMRHAMWAQIVIMGEAVRRLPESRLDQHPSVSWSTIAGMRHRLVHGYDVIDWGIVWNVVTMELPILSSKLKHILDTSPDPES